MSLRTAALSATLLAAPAGVGGTLYSFRHVPAEAPPPSPPSAETALTIRYLGVTGYEISDGETTIILDPMVNRPGPASLLTQRIRPDPQVSAQWVPEADYILINHAHFDHVLDAPEIALRTGATVLGTQSAVNLALSRGVPASQTKALDGGETLTLGTFAVEVIRRKHSPVLGKSEPMAGVIAPDAGLLRFFEYKQDGVLCYRLEAAGASVWFHPSVSYDRGVLVGREVDTLIMGINGEGATAEGYRAIVEDLKPRRVLPTHYDNFFQPIQKGLALFPDIDLEQRREDLIGDEDIEWVVLNYDQTLTVGPDVSSAPPDR